MSARKEAVIATVVFVVFGVYTLSGWNIPQCPENYSQEQVNAAQGFLGLFPKCIIGANIGSGIYLFVTIGVAIFASLRWATVLSDKRRKK